MKQKKVIAIGNFDGFHLGHKKIISELFHIEKKENLSPVLVTFSPNPKVFFKKETHLIFTDKQKSEFLLNMGLDRSFFLDFNNISKISGRQFVLDTLIEELEMSHLVVGYNFKFGKNRDCDITTLKELSVEFGFGLTVIAPIMLYGEKISSTLIRSKIREGKVDDAARLLGHNFYIDGIVTKGIGRGKDLGFPTVNILTENDLFPKGVFKTYVQIENESYDSVTNIGSNPTFNYNENMNGSNLKIETHILNFNKTLYGESIRIFFKNKLRDEKKFKSKNELINQIKKDIG